MKTLFCLAMGAALALISCETSQRDNPDTMLRTESWDGTGPVGGPTSASGPGAIGGGTNSGGSGTGAMTGPGTAAGAASYSSGRGP